MGSVCIIFEQHMVCHYGIHVHAFNIEDIGVVIGGGGVRVRVCDGILIIRD